MTPIELLESVKERFNPPFVKKKQRLKVFLIKAPDHVSGQGRVVKTLNLKELVVLQSCCQKIISGSCYRQQRPVGLSSDELSGFIELELTGSERYLSNAVSG
uniref:Uncharacterized protein n=1 Tax=Salmonella sp. TaxID=599 RepID=A0A482ETE6_SALSP|nr:hypothetical protein [Salmonella sp.]QBM91477.1 hypothetical protein NNIBIDOC_00148 [Salmonella sp.]